MIDWVAPRDGIVLERNAIEGMRAQPGDVLFRIADLSVVWALVDVAERDLGALAVGQTVERARRALIRSASSPARSAVIYPQFDRDTRTARVRVELANPDALLLPDMYVDAEIAAGNRRPVLAVPESAVIDTGERQIVLIDKGEGRFEPREVKLGARGGGYVEMREGVAEGDAVVVVGEFPDRRRKQPEGGAERPVGCREQAMIARLIAWSARNLLLVLFGAGFRRGGGPLCADARCRSTPSPISPTRKSSSTPNIPARRRRWSRIRSPIR